jgi:hypothetical protein
LSFRRGPERERYRWFDSTPPSLMGGCSVG